MSENKFQARIVRSIRMQGGFARKWASEYNIGVPDLIGAIPTIGTFFMEVKLFNSGIIDKKIGTTPIQRHTMHQMEAAGMLCMVVPIVVYAPGVFYTYAYKPEEQRITKENMKTTPHVFNKKRQLIDIHELVLKYKEWRLS